MNTKKFTILHSNDMHGDFLAEAQGADGAKLTATSLFGVIEEYLRGHQNLNRQVEGRLVYR